MSNDTLAKILASNPNARRDEKILREGLAAVESLRTMGIKPREYKLKSPFQRVGKPSPKQARYRSASE